jgi:hypothetical protein
MDPSSERGFYLQGASRQCGVLNDNGITAYAAAELGRAFPCYGIGNRTLQNSDNNFVASFLGISNTTAFQSAE